MTSWPALTNLALSSLAIATTWGALALVLLGVGLGWFRLMGAAIPRGQEWFLAFWAGFATTLLILQGWHFLAPITGIPLAFIALIGIAGWWLYRGSWPALELSKGLVVQGSILIAAALLVANHATGPGTQYDTGLYQAQVVEWSSRFAVVPGLANLHGRLAFNNASLLFAALLDTGPWAGASNHLANGLLVVALTWLGLVSLFRLARAAIALPDVFNAVLLTPAAIMTLHPALRSYATDLAVTVVLFTAASIMVRILSGGSTAPDATRALRIVVATLLLASAVAIKLSAVGFAAPGIVLLLWWWFRHDPASERLGKRVLVGSAVFGLLLGGSWLARGAVLSGYPAYPSPVLRISASWTVPAEQAKAEQAWVMHTARYEAGEFGTGWTWFVPWLRKLWAPYPLLRFVLPLAVAVVALLALVLPLGRAPPIGSAWWLVVPIGSGAAFWFLTAPSVRFGFTFAWLLAALCVGQAVIRRGGSLRSRSLVIGLVALALAPIGFSVVRYLMRESPSAGEAFRFLSYVVVVRPAPDMFLHPMPVPVVDSYTTASGLVVNVPRDGDTCWRASIPCTPHPTKALALRRPDDLGGGFHVVGPWRPERWPARSSVFLPWWRCRTGHSTGDDTACRASH